MVGPNKPQFVLFGSSIVQMCYKVGGWGAMLADLYVRKADILTTTGILWLEFKDGSSNPGSSISEGCSGQPSPVILYFGGNDATNPHPSGLGGHVPLAEYVKNMKRMIVHIKGLSYKTRMICLTLLQWMRQKLVNFLELHLMIKLDRMKVYANIIRL